MISVAEIACRALTAHVSKLAAPLSLVIVGSADITGGIARNIQPAHITTSLEVSVCLIFTGIQNTN